MKKTIVIHTDWSKLKTGFSKSKRAILRHLYNIGKYRVVEAANGMPYDAPELSRMPWEAYGTAPSPEKQQELANIQDPAQREAHHRIAQYGGFGLEKIIKNVKPDIWVAMQDSWGLDFIPDFKWSKNLKFVPWCTIDSSPLMPAQVDLAAKVDKLYLWASFGVSLYNEKGHFNVEHLYGCVETDKFFPIIEEERKKLREKFKIDDCFVGIKVFRNQTRKSIPNLLDGFKLFQSKFPEAKGKLILVTSLKEGWNTPQMIKDRELNNNDILFAHYCRNCQGWEVRPFNGHDLNCPICGAEKTFNTVDIIHGVTDESLNLIYNCADYALGVQNSGGMEIGISVEAKLAGLPALCTKYSCGEDVVASGRGALPLDYDVYYEFGSSFKKASTCPKSICEKMGIVYSMTEEERIKMGAEGRKYVLENISPEVIGGKLEEVFDVAPFANWDNFSWEPEPKNPSHIPPQGLSPEEFILDIFHNIMGENFDKNNSNIKFWVDHLVKSQDYNGVLKHFQNLAAQSNNQAAQKPVELADLLDKDDEGKRACIVMPESAGDLILINSLLKKFKALYPEYNLYFFTKPEFFELIEHREEVHKVLAYSPQIDDMFALTGRWKHRGAFEMAFFPHSISQKTMSYQSNNHNARAEWL